ncbi:hypothetical protein, partial [Acinetobacter junii]|uniref:hypothetical protein n=1 Tax=Acinetobacter junii TaxID=40215 RepID=UPI0012FFE182
EADIRKKLLPMMFKECKAIGSGMDHAKKIVEMIVQITRVGLNQLLLKWDEAAFVAILPDLRQAFTHFKPKETAAFAEQIAQL